MMKRSQVSRYDGRATSELVARSARLTASTADLSWNALRIRCTGRSFASDLLSFYTTIFSTLPQFGHSTLTGLTVQCWRERPRPTPVWHIVASPDTTAQSTAYTAPTRRDQHF